MREIHEGQFDLNLIRVFHKIYETRNVSAAARELSLTQSGISHALKRLRLELSDPLFVRTSAGMQPTPYADQLSEVTGRPLDDLFLGIQLGRTFNPLNSERAFKLYLSDVGQLVLLPRLLTFLNEHAPATKIQVVSASKVKPDIALENGEVDLAIGHLTTLVSGFFQKTLFREHYVCVMRVDHPLFIDGMSLEAFEKAHHALADSTGMAHAILERSLRDAGVHRIVQLRVPQFMVLPFVIQESDLVVIMPSRLANQFSKLLSLKALPLPVSVAAKPYDINVYWHSRYNEDPANVWLRRSISTLFENSKTGL